MIHEELSGKIIGAGMDVLNELRPGLDDPAPAGLQSAREELANTTYLIFRPDLSVLSV
jgi:hypothetical protein